MKSSDRNMKYLLIGSFVLLLSACSGGGGGGGSSSTSKTTESSPAAATTLTGTVADGYLRDAQVFLDRNYNRVYDSGEPMSYSAAGGGYSLDVNAGDGDTYPVVARAIAGQTVDEDLGATVADDYVLEAPEGRWDFISPLTTLVKLEMDKNPSFTVQQAENSIRSQLGVDDTISLFDDYMTGGLVEPASAQEFERTHQVARVVAALMGSIRTDVTQNLGGLVNDSDQPLVSYLISDQVMTQAATIQAAINNERNGGDSVDVDILTASLEDAIDTTALNADLLARYEERQEQNLDEWDMQAPELISQEPPADDTASIDVIVEAGFDEALDQSQLTDGVMTLVGPSGTVTGTLQYDAEQKILTFTPDAYLLPDSTYQVILSAAISDELGNSLGDAVSWTFTTIFDQLPPALPDF